MYEELIDRILGSLNKSLNSSKYPVFSGEGYAPCRIDINNFHEINPAQLNKRIAFIDGGNAEITGSKNFSLSLIRLGCVAYAGSGKIRLDKHDFFIFVDSIGKDNEIRYDVSVFPSNKNGDCMNLKGINFSSLDPNLMHGLNRADISSVGSAVRRFAELGFAKKIAEEKCSDILILDGNLQSTLTNESSHLQSLYGSCMKNGTILCGLSKTNSIFTDSGSLLGVVLDSLSTLQRWFYHPIAKISAQSHKADMFLVKMHNKSKHVFRLDIFDKQAGEAQDTINALSYNCTDPIFAGYPYGLVQADGIARISNSEKSSLKTLLIHRLKNKNVEKYLSQSNAHEILDRISF